MNALKTNQLKFEHFSSISCVEILINETEDIFMIIYPSNHEVTLKEAIEIVSNLYLLLKEHNIKYLISDISADFHTVSGEARIYFSNNPCLEIINAHAVLAKNLAARIRLNFFILFDKPIVPFKGFNDLEKAVNWLYAKND